MIKISTADCRKFLVSEITKNPDIIHWIYGDTTTAIAEALVEKNWKREAKFSPTSDHHYADDSYEVLGEDRRNPRVFLPHDLVCVRTFCLLPSKFDTAVKYNILEGKDGNLYLSEYVGD
jgi:hypothetical protein